MTVDEHPQFEAAGPPLHVKSRGWVYPVKNPGGYPEPGVLLGRRVLIDDQPFTVAGVEAFAIARPYPDRLDFALLVREAT